MKQPIMPAPWNLEGMGYILIYRWGREFMDRQHLVPEFLKDRPSGGFGAMMIVDYASSDVGPYRELVFLSDAFRTDSGRRRNVPRIFVSTEASVVNGIRNWAIPKELAEFGIERPKDHTERITVRRPGMKPFLDITMSYGGPELPVSTALMPMPLIQKQDGKLYRTQFGGKGRGRLARIRDCRVVGNDFPDISKVRPLVAARVDPFNIVFPEAEIEFLETVENR